ncbi:MAG: GNAT family N-acetyltransferase [Anaerolineae bacterium]|jgi:GNAT superfamily N-acetyltransferase
MEPIVYREMRPEDVPGWRLLHCTHFPPLTDEQGLRWASREDVTAALALRGDEPVGAIPFHIRDFRTAPGVTVRGAFEHAVLVHESMRDQGVGSKMMDLAKEFFLGRCDALMVYRGAERSAGYRFYARNGHHDLSYWRPLILEEPCPQPLSGAEHSGLEPLLEREDEFLAVFESAYAGFGGFPQRRPGYWQWAFDSAYFDMIPQEFVLIRREEGNAIQGYVLLGREVEHPRVHLLEVATRNADADLARALLQEAITLAAQWQATFRAFSTDHSPYARTLLELGFRAVPRSESSMMTMAYVLDPATLGPRVWQENEETEGLEVDVWTPLREAIIHQPTGATKAKVTLEMKEETLTRLLFNRLDLLAAVRQESVTVVGGGAKEVEAIARALPLAPWAYSHVDYI